MDIPTKWDEQLNLCLTLAESHSKKWANGVRNAVFDDRKKTFEKRETYFKDQKAKDVMDASRFVGKVAHLSADHFGRDEVSKDDVCAGLAAALHVCKARLSPGQAGKDEESAMLLFWCE